METQRLIIRKFANSDLEDFIELIQDKMNSEYSIYDIQYPTDVETLKNVLDHFSKTEEYFAVENKKDKKVIGFVCLNFEDENTRNLGYCIHTKYQNNHFASEAVKEIIKYAKNTLKIKKLIAGTAEVNLPSVKLLLNSGFKIVEKKKVSFVNDKSGKPIIFDGILFEQLF